MAWPSCGFFSCVRFDIRRWSERIFLGSFRERFSLPMLIFTAPVSVSKEDWHWIRWQKTLLCTHRSQWNETHLFPHFILHLCFPSTAGTTDVEMKDHLVGAQGYQRFPLFKPVFGQSIALRAASADRASVLTCLVTAFPMPATSHFPKNFC